MISTENSGKTREGARMGCGSNDLTGKVMTMGCPCDDDGFEDGLIDVRSV